MRNDMLNKMFAANPVHNGHWLLIKFFLSRQLPFPWQTGSKLEKGKFAASGKKGVLPSGRRVFYSAVPR
jgi:hypothetical protein